MAWMPDDDAGATITEYVLMLLFIAIVASIGMVVLGNGMDDALRSTAEGVGSNEVGEPGG